MKNINLLLCLTIFLLTPLWTQATHVYSGHISYTTDHENPRKIHFVLTLYNNIESPADEPYANVNMGDGIFIQVNRSSHIQISQKSTQNLYRWSHTYPMTGTFQVSWHSENRNNGIVNIPQPSAQISNHITTTVRVGSLFLNKSGPQIAGIPVFDVYAGEPFKHNLLAYDLDGDHLLYSLAVPEHRSAGGVAGPIPGYTFPEGLTINEYGELNWPTPTEKGYYVVAVRITDWLNGQNISSVIVDILFHVTERTIQPQFSLVNRNRLQVGADGSIQAWPGQPVKLEYHLRKAADSDLALDVKTFGEIDSLQLTETAIQMRDTVDGYAVTYTFVPTQEMERPTPYLIGIRGKSQLRGSLSGTNRFEFGWDWAYVYVGAERPLSSGDTADPGITRLYPNPARGEFTFEAPDLPGLQLLVHDITGKVVARFALKPGRNDFIRPAKLASGLYTYTLTSQFSPIEVGKLVLQ